ncbi:LytTR family DNA-binding domain-containing protein [Antarcticimicrobium luteum]|uniref:LytTR family transcriptional regulator n=1 Tax=Antarcticimicrobium luteum TaxID=2547397 RepID=A0A4V3ARU6_9RHOB|nr:LytTR family DNA-binding domain-containing protein [Antarcticimicrobium luteum]TDK48027.1 LytTR family transcriptional regulator [Antarcticimicrobium luteum]
MTFFSNRLIRRRFLSPFSRGEAAIWSLFSFFAAYTGPFGTYSLGFGRRLAYWTLVVILSALMANAFARAARRLIGPGHRQWRDLVVVVLMTVFFTPVLIGLTRYFLKMDFSNLSDALYFGQYVAIISLGVTSGRRVLPRMIPGLHSDMARWGAVAPPDPVPEPDPEAEADAETPPQPRLKRRLPDSFQGPILRLTVEDHFVDVIAPGTVYRLRMRFADAIDEMDPVEGFCTHRSHWVRRDAVDGVERDGTRVLLRLTNGDLVPVSRTYRPKLEQAGLL